MCMPPICSSSTNSSRTDYFSPSFFPPPEISLFGEFQLHPLWDSRGDEVFNLVISSDLLPLNVPNTPTLLHRSSGSAPLLTSSLLTLLLPFLAPGRCFRTWVLTTCQFFYPSLSIRSIAPTSVPLPSIFRKLAGMTLPPTLTLTVFLQRNTRLFLFPLLLLFLPLSH